MSEIPLSKALTITASRHTLDTVYNLGGYDGHNWSDALYDSSNSETYPAMWFAPDRIGTGYTDHGFEISTGYIGDALSVPDMTPEVALEGWKGSAGHNNVITEQGSWDRGWDAIGVAIHESVAHVWFGWTADPTGLPDFEAGVQPIGTGVNPDPQDEDVLTGTDGNDIITGTASADVVNGGAGSDVLYAGSSMTERGTGDTARFDGQSGDFDVRGGINYAVVTGLDGARDKVFGFEFLQFDDRVMVLNEGSALDNVGAPEDFVTAERVALLYEAALNRDGNIDLPGLNFYIGVTERDNLSDAFLARNLMISPEFTANFGDANTLSNSDFLEQIYLNVLDRPSDAAGRQFYVDLLNRDVITKSLALADIAVSPENAAESTSVLMGLYESAGGEWGFL